MLEQTATEVFKTLPYDDILWTIEIEKYFGNEDRPGLWSTFLEVEKENFDATDFLPAKFETSFGHLSSDSVQMGNPPLILYDQDRLIKIYGKIDRIDINSDGKFSVIDYKTGAGALGINLAQIIKGESLQLPIYIAAVEKILSKEKRELFAVAGIYYQVQDGYNCRKKPVFVDLSVSHQIRSAKDSVLPNPKYTEDGEVLSFSDVIKTSLDHVIDYVQGIAFGNFRHTFHPKNEKCATYC